MARIGPILVIFDPLINYIKKKNWTPLEKTFLIRASGMVFITCKHRQDATDHKRKMFISLTYCVGTEKNRLIDTFF